MKQKVYCVRDAKAEVYLTPFFSRNDGTAMREFSAPCQDPSHQFGKFPEDYTLWRIGTYDQLAGAIEGEISVQIATAFQFIEAE